MKRILVIAGADSSGGAGLARDVTVATELGCAVAPIVTAVTAQTDSAVHDIHPIPAGVVQRQIEAAIDQAAPDAIKIGMLGTPDIASTLALALRSTDAPIVLDPVLKSSSGDMLVQKAIIEPLLSLVALVTPNLPEAAALTNSPCAIGGADMAFQAELLHEMGAQAVLIKGGHGEGADCVDHLYHPSAHVQFTSRRLGKSKRGTGCALSTAIACNLALGYDLSTACRRAKVYVHSWVSKPA